ncbi:MAG: histidinol phosphate phosphatase domain-containing protein [Veillonellaceae bacterium]|nr:histidinol phosphate phosphatase domain-containing protein [Veillonellaceae bacterium]
MTFDFHTHSFFSDGVLSPIELIRRAHVAGYRAIAVTDHVGLADMESTIREVAKDCAMAEKYWGVKALPGVELTHVPAAAINDCARQAKSFGARIVVVHGETPVEPVEAGTNRAALMSSYVDVLAHPGFLTTEEAQIAVVNDIFLEVTARGGHCLTNGHVVKVGLAVGAKLLVNSDCHTPDNLMKEGFAAKVAQGAGIPVEILESVLLDHPMELLRRLEKSERNANN